MKADQERVKNLLIDTVTLLCKNSLSYQDELCIEGLLGVKVDQKDVFFVHISQTFQSELRQSSAPDKTVSGSQETNSHPSGDTIRIKRETIHHSPVRDPGAVPGAQRAEMVAGHRRVANNHHHSPLPSRTSSSPRGGADHPVVSQANNDSLAENQDSNLFGEPPTKRRLKSETFLGEEDSQLNDDSIGDSNAWPHLVGTLGTPNLASHIAQSTLRDFENSQQGGTDGSQPGPSTWPFVPGMLQQTTADMTSSGLKGLAGGGWMTPGGRGAAASRAGKDFPCEVCGKVFHMGHHLRQHLRIHTGERPYRCDRCGSTFTQISSLNRHQRAMHCSAAKLEAAAANSTLQAAGLIELPENILGLAKEADVLEGGEDSVAGESGGATSPPRHVTSDAMSLTATSPPGSAQYMCTDCNIEFKQYDRFLEHVNSSHNVS